MRLRHVASGEEFTVEIIEKGIPDTIAGPLAFKRTDTDAFLPMKKVFGFDSQFSIVEYSAKERRRLEAIGVPLTVRPIIRRVGHRWSKCQPE